MLDLKYLQTLIPRLKEKAELRVFRPPLDVTVELVALDRYGKVEGRRLFRSHSFLQNFIDIQMYGLFKSTSAQAAIGITGRDINGTYRNIFRGQAFGANAWQSPSPIATSGAYIVVGTGSTAVANADFQLVGQAGQVAATVGDPITVSLTRSFTLSGAVSLVTQTTINEVGFKMVFGISAQGGTAATDGNVFLLVRDIVSGGFVVSAGGSIVVTYTISAAS